MVIVNRKNFITLIGSRTRDLPACSTVPQQTRLQCAPLATLTPGKIPRYPLYKRLGNRQSGSVRRGGDKDLYHNLPPKVIQSVAIVINPLSCIHLLCGSCKNRRFGRKYRFHHQDENNQQLLTAKVGPSSLIIFALMMIYIPPKRRFLTRTTRRFFPEEGILHSHRHENFKSYIALTCWALFLRRNVSPVRYELEVHTPEDGILHSHRSEDLKPYIILTGWVL
jgi:hypothetical protein